FSIAGKSPRAVLLAQTVVDLATCFLIALIAARLAPASSRRRVALAGLWLAALCPFTANYTAVVQTETLITFLTALAILLLIEAMRSAGRGGSEGSAVAQPAVSRGTRCWVWNAGPSGDAAVVGCGGLGARGTLAQIGRLAEPRSHRP